MITTKDIVIIDISLTKEEIEKCTKIAENTANTWQINRKSDEKNYNTIMGKLAEKALKKYLDSLGFKPCCFNNENIIGTELFAFYDDFRNDNFEYHNDIDLIFSKNTALLFLAIKRIRDKSQKIEKGKYFKLDDETKKKMNDNGVFICEVKSTKITDRHRKNGKVCLDKILSDDFLEYPKYCRSSDTILDLNNYLSFVNDTENKQYEDLKTLLDDEKESVSDIYFRIYIEIINPNENYQSNAYIIGLIEKKDFFNEKNITLKKMSQKDKSEKAIYFAVELKKGKPIKDFLSIRYLVRQSLTILLNNYTGFHK